MQIVEMNNREQLQNQIDFHFRDIALLQSALTHRSYTAEVETAIPDNQRLEFLGDAVIQIIVTSRLYRDYPDAAEGHLTKLRATLTRQETLADFARDLKLGDYLQLGHGEHKNRGYDLNSNLCDAFEALFGAIFLDCQGTLKEADRLLNELIDNAYDDLEARLLDANPKGTLQEKAQQLFHEKPRYETLESEGPDHHKTFKVAVFINGECYGEGIAKRMRTAEQEAARVALKNLQDMDSESCD